MSTTKSVIFGSQQEAVLTPKEGFMVESVKIINTATNEEIHSELLKTCENPAQWTCRFKQPAGSVAVRPSIVPITYTVTIEECDNCNIVLVDQDALADFELKTVDTSEETATSDENQGEVSSNFNIPQHSFENGAEQALDVEVLKNDVSQESFGEDSNVSDVSVSNAGIYDDADENVEFSDTSETEDNIDNMGDGVSDATEDQVYEAGEFEDDLNDKEPVVMTQAEFDKKCATFWTWRESYAAGEVTEEAFKDVEKKHNQLFIDINEGKVKIID